MTTKDWLVLWHNEETEYYVCRSSVLRPDADDTLQDPHYFDSLEEALASVVEAFGIHWVIRPLPFAGYAIYALSGDE